MIKHPFVESWKYLKKHPKILVPKIIYLIVVAGVAFLLADQFLAIKNAFSLDYYSPELFTDEVYTAINYSILFGLFVFLFDIAYSSMFFGLIKDILTKNKCLLSECGSHLKKFFLPVLKMRLWMGLFYVIGTIATFLITIIAGAILPEASLFTFIASAGIIYLGLSLVLLFRYPTLIMENVKPLEALKIAYSGFKKHMKYNLYVAITLFFVAVLSTLITNRIALTGITPLNIVSVVLELIVSVWIAIFLFSAYHLKDSKKKKK